MKKFIFPLIIASTIFTTGCNHNGQKRPSVEDLSLISSLGFDLSNEKYMRLTVAIPEPENESPILTQTYSIDTEMIQEGITHLSSESDKMMVLHQLRTLVFSEAFAKSGKVTSVVEHLYRDSTIGNNVRLVIVEEDAESILRANYSESKHMDAYLNDLFQPSLHSSFSPFTSIHDYMTTQTSPIYHTMIPYVEKKDGSLKVTKIALFNTDRMVDTISNDHSLLIQALSGRNKLSPLVIKFKDNPTDKQVFLEQIDSQVKVISNKNIEDPKVDISLKIKAVLVEYRGDRDLTKPDQAQKLTVEIEKHLQNEIEELFEKLKKLELDPVGLSEYFRMYYKGKWTDKLTEKVISSLKYNVKVEFKITNHGTLK